MGMSKPDVRVPDTLEVVGGGAKADVIPHNGIGGAGAAARKRSGAGDQRHLAIGSAHVDTTGRVRGRQIDGAARAGRLPNQVILARLQGEVTGVGYLQVVPATDLNS